MFIVLCVLGVIASYFMEAVDAAGGCPEVIRTDCGTENVTLAALQTFMRRDTDSHIVMGESKLAGDGIHLTDPHLKSYERSVRSAVFHTV